MTDTWIRIALLGQHICLDLSYSLYLLFLVNTLFFNTQVHSRFRITEKVWNIMNNCMVLLGSLIITTTTTLFCHLITTSSHLLKQLEVFFQSSAKDVETHAPWHKEAKVGKGQPFMMINTLAFCSWRFWQRNWCTLHFSENETPSSIRRQKSFGETWEGILIKKIEYWRYLLPQITIFMNIKTLDDWNIVLSDWPFLEAVGLPPTAEELKNLFDVPVDALPTKFTRSME